MDYKKFRQAKAIEAKNKQKWLALNPGLDESSGIYILTRQDENGFRYAYVGQAKHILSRLSQHLAGYQHIDLSIKKRGFYSEENPYGWKLNFIHYPREKLDEMEQYWILEYTKKGYQCRYNKTAGGQGTGKEKINEFKPAKGYYDGIKHGKKSLAKELSHIAEKHLEIRLKTEKQGNKVSEKQYEKFMALISENTYEESGNE